VATGGKTEGECLGWVADQIIPKITVARTIRGDTGHHTIVQTPRTTATADVITTFKTTPITIAEGQTFVLLQPVDIATSPTQLPDASTRIQGSNDLPALHTLSLRYAVRTPLCSTATLSLTTRFSTTPILVQEI
jgi:hypothetical protein